MKKCPYCDELKERLDEMKIQYDEVDIHDNEEVFNEICKTTKTETVPLVLVGKFIVAAELSFRTIEEASLIIQKLVR